MVNDALKEELETGVHALSVQVIFCAIVGSFIYEFSTSQAKTPSQWEKSNAVTVSPPCLGGSKH